MLRLSWIWSFGHVPKISWFSFTSVQLLSSVRLFATPWTVACQASLSITNSQSSPKPMSTELVMPSSHLILCHPLLLLPSIFPSIRVFSNESTLCIRWPKYWSFSFSVSPSNAYSRLNPLGLTGVTSLPSKGCSLTTIIQEEGPRTQGLGQSPAWCPGGKLHSLSV